MIANIRRFKGARPIPPVDLATDPDRRPLRRLGRGRARVSRHHRRPRASGPSRLGQEPALRQRHRAQRHRGREGQHRRAEQSLSTCGPLDKLTSPTGPNWMLLFIDADGDAKDRLAGLRLRRQPQVSATPRRPSSSGTSAADTRGARPSRSLPGRAATRWSSRSPVSSRQLPHCRPTIDFKWADNIQQTGEWSDFTINGDAAPNDRYNYRAKFHAAARYSPR